MAPPTEVRTFFFNLLIKFFFFYSKIQNGDERGGQGRPPGSSNNNILFDQSKNEQITLTNGFKKLQMHLKNWKLSK